MKNYSLVEKSVGWSIINITTNEGEIEDWKYMY